jgi:HlyD family secretion protein
MKKKISIAIIITILVVVGIILATTRGNSEIEFNTAKAQQDSIQVFVTATGYLQPVDQINVGTQVSGVIEKIHVDFNSQVKKGQLLAELDKATLRERLSQAKASRSNAKSDLVLAKQNYTRISTLYEAKAATQVAYEDATNRLEQAKNALINANANYQQSHVNLSFADIYSPISGVVLNRAVDQGQTVASSFATPTLFTIANDLKKMQVEANVDEADIGSVRRGQSVSFTVDSYPDQTFSGTVEQIRLQPVVTSNVVTYVVIIDAPNPDEKLYPGMTASVSIQTQNANGIVVPAEAVQFSPDVETIKNLKIDKALLSNGKDKYVWIKSGTTIRSKVVKTGVNDGINYIIESGLEAGEEVILSVIKEEKSR